MRYRELTEEKWWDDTNIIRLYHGTSSALLPFITKDGLTPPQKELDEYAFEVLSLYIPPNEWTEELRLKALERAARIGGGRGGESGRVIFCMTTAEGPSSYARSVAEHGGEIASDVYRLAVEHVRFRDNPETDEMSYGEYQALPAPFPPRFVNAKPVVLELLVPKDWCLFYHDLERVKSGVQKARSEGRSWATEHSLEHVYDDILDGREVRITQIVPPHMIQAVHEV